MLTYFDGSWLIYCTLCGKKGPNGIWPHIATARAEGKGWHIQSHLDIAHCPECKEKHAQPPIGETMEDWDF